MIQPLSAFGRRTYHFGRPWFSLTMSLQLRQTLPVPQQPSLLPTPPLQKKRCLIQVCRSIPKMTDPSTVNVNAIKSEIRCPTSSIHAFVVTSNTSNRSKFSYRAAIINPKANACPMAVRVAWHASGTYDSNTSTGGSNGIVLQTKTYFCLAFRLIVLLYLGATTRFEPESTDPANAVTFSFPLSFLNPSPLSLSSLCSFGTSRPVSAPRIFNSNSGTFNHPRSSSSYPRAQPEPQPSRPLDTGRRQCCGVPRWPIGASQARPQRCPHGNTDSSERSPARCLSGCPGCAIRILCRQLPFSFLFLAPS